MVEFGRMVLLFWVFLASKDVTLCGGLSGFFGVRVGLYTYWLKAQITYMWSVFWVRGLSLPSVYLLYFVPFAMFSMALFSLLDTSFVLVWCWCEWVHV